MIKRIKFKGNGTVLTLSTFTFLIVSVFCIYCIYLFIVTAYSEKAYNALTSSNLAAYKDIDRYLLSEYPNNFTLTNNAYNTFKLYLKKNLNLDDNLCASGNSFLKGKVNIDNFTIYNVKGNDINILSYNNGSFDSNTIKNGVGNFKSPKGNVINNTKIYSKISYNILIFNQLQKVPISFETHISK